MQDDSGSGHYQAAAKVGKNAVDEGTGVALAINAADVNGITTTKNLPVRGRCHGLAAVDKATALLGVVLGSKLLYGNPRPARVRDIAKRIGKGQSHGLNQVMIPVGALPAHGLYVEALDDVQRLQGGDTLPVGGTLPAGSPPVVGGDGLIPVGAVARQVFVGQPSALFLDKGRYLLGYFPLIKGRGSLLPL